jgi:two-component sensor histidine kinase
VYGDGQGGDHRGLFSVEHFLRRRIVAQPTNPAIQAGWGCLCALLAIGFRFALSPILGDFFMPFVFFFPAVAAAGIMGGAVGGTVGLILCAIGGLIFFMEPVGALSASPKGLLALGVFLLSGGVMLILIVLLRRSLLALHAATEQERLLLGELQHRVKNTLAVVQSVASQSLRSDGDITKIKEVFTERLGALARAHSLLSDAAWGPVSLSDVCGRALEPFTLTDAERIQIRGEEVLLPSDHVVGLALCFHELATNAIKYGAHSEPDGRIEITWELVPEKRRVKLCWEEWGGPKVKAPKRAGFGTRVLKQGLAGRGRPEVSMDFLPSGVVWRASFDLDP